MESDPRRNRMICPLVEEAKKRKTSVDSEALTLLTLSAYEDPHEREQFAETVIVKIVDASYYAASATACCSVLSSLTGLSQTSSTWSHVRVCRAHRWGFSALACS